MKITKLIIISILIMLPLLSFSQKKEDVIELTARVLDSGTKKHISFVKVVNLKKRRAVKTDSLGFLNIAILKGDILRFSAIGYYTKYITFNDTIQDDLKVRIVELEEKTYEFSKVDVFKGRWDDLKFEMTHTEIAEEKTKEQIENWLLSLISTQELAMITNAASVGIPITYTSKREKQQQKVQELMILDREEKIIYTKYNRVVVREVTGMKGAELSKFMHFCNFKRNFLLHANDYDIVNEIKKRESAFKKRRKTSFN